MLWNLGGQGGVQIVRLTGMLVLATLLAPGDFGLMAMVWAVTGLVELFVDLGTGQAIIQRKELTPRLCSSVFWANVVFAGLAACVVATGAVTIAALFQEPALRPLIIAIAPVFLPASLGVVPSALLQRSMRFDKVARARIVGAVAGAGTSITAACLGHGVWSLVYGHYAGAIATATLLWTSSRWWPTFAVSFADLRAVAGFSLNLAAVNLSNFVFGQIDTLVVGRWLGRDVLGCYSLAKKIVLQPILLAGSSVANVLFSRFARMAEDPEAIRPRYLDASAAVVALLAPVALGMAIVAGPAVEAFGGVGWELVAPIVALLAPAALIATVMMPTGALFRAVGRTDLLLRLGLVRGAAMALGVTAGAWLDGAGGAAIGLSTAMAIMLVPSLCVPFRLVDLELLAGLRALLPIGNALVGLALCAFGGLWLATALGASPGVATVLVAASGATGYFAVLWLVRPAFLVPLLGPRFVRMEVRT